MGHSYEGEYKNGKKEGQGTMRYVSGNVYEGQWKADKKEGLGTYQGHTQRALPHAVHLSSVHCRLRAPCVAQARTATPRATCRTKASTRTTSRRGEGPTQDACPHRAPCTRCTADPVHRAQEGRGTTRSVEGDTYEGELKAGKSEGRGTLRYADGRAEVGRYSAGAKVGEAARWSADGNKARGAQYHTSTHSALP